MSFESMIPEEVTSCPPLTASDHFMNFLLADFVEKGSFLDFAEMPLFVESEDSLKIT